MDHSSLELSQIGIKPGDIFLTCVSRKPTREQFKQELERYFNSELYQEDRLDESFSIVACKPYENE